MYPLSHYLMVNPASENSLPSCVASTLYWQQNQPVTYIGNLEIIYTNYQTAIEEELKTFISWVLQVTVTGEYTGDIAMELLDQAWMAQKLVWWLRELHSC